MVEPSKSGAALKRALVDVAAAKGSERLIFEANPLSGRALSEFHGRSPVIQAASSTSTWRSCDGAEHDERKLLKSIWAEAMAKAPRAEAAREKWLKVRGAEIARRQDPAVEGRGIAEREAAQFEAGECATITRSSGQRRMGDGLPDPVRPDRYTGARCWSLDETGRAPASALSGPIRRGRTMLGKPPGPGCIVSSTVVGISGCVRSGPRPNVSSGSERARAMA